MLKGNKIRLRAYKREELKLVMEFINDEDVTKFLRPGVPFPFRYEDEIKFYESLNPMSTSSYSFAIELLETEKYIGGCGINEIDWKNSVATVGIFLGKPYWNKGYGTEALKILVDFIFNEMNINKVKLNVYSFNERAIKSYKKVGFVVEGRLRQEIFKEGKYYDEIIMGILRSEYKI
ncbi:N-acetyltransferase [Tepiditoga spiralis]|uniref:N-acetyltransferase n=1 Tax=Tepiditoga spiralis TaxID=2108365 RepID=A0A7G1G2A6_9BACT|nr:GNAT family protein [Tepiditoga spiralis]BBE30378.1 N-acetyltransferase [Tepiditoga spiralis]